jgi:pyrimidine operon attenuation protein/uracil phosphoribosyltransferase
MQRRLVIDNTLLDITLSRLAHQLIENHGDFASTVMIGLQPRGVLLANRLKIKLDQLLENPIKLGYLDTTFHRDDFRRRDVPLAANTTEIPFLIENKNVILVDDVLYTGRSVRAALDAMITFGRPKKVELLVLINRKYTRQLPVEPTYVGSAVHTIDTQKVLVEWNDDQTGNVWLTTKQET